MRKKVLRKKNTSKSKAIGIVIVAIAIASFAMVSPAVAQNVFAEVWNNTMDPKTQIAIFSL